MSLLSRILLNYKKWDFILFLVFTSLSLINGSTTVFFLIYLFWWTELIRLIVDSLKYKTNPNAEIISGTKTPSFESYFLMGIYLIFILVFFGIIANWNQHMLLFSNLKVVFFRNWVFNTYLIIILVERIYIHSTKQQVAVSFGAFTPNMIILHIAIILGGLLLFFVVQKFPEVFTPTNFWSSAVIAAPFLLLKLLVLRLKA